MFRNIHNKHKNGFTIAELLVSVTIFATTLSVMMVLLNYTLKIHRKTEALRQASQGMRNFMEFLVKEIRNGKIDYGVANGQVLSTTKSPCVTAGSVGADTYGNDESSTHSNVSLGLVNVNNEQECIFWAKDAGGGAVTSLSIPADLSNGNAKYLALAKSGVTQYEKLNPAGMTVEYLRFYVRPTCDPYTPTCSGGLPTTQPFVTVVARFIVTLATGEKVILPYQTTITSDDYAIPRN